MFYYSIKRHISNWDDIILGNEKEWSKKDFDALLHSAYLAALRRIGNRPEADHDLLLPRYAIEYMAKYGFVECPTPSTKQFREETGWFFLSACWFNLERVNLFLRKYPGKWLVVTKDMRSKEFGSLGEITVLAVEDSYEKAQARFPDFHPDAVDSKTGFYNHSKVPPGEPLLDIIKVPKKDSFFVTEEVNPK